MIPRICIDIGWRDLARAAGLCVWGSGDVKLPSDVAPANESLVTLSVRSAFDLLLEALELPAESEVLLSEVTVPHMPRIVREHGLIPVAVPVDPRTLSVTAEDVAQQITPRTKLLVIAHLFGARAPLDELGRLCRERGVLLVEDCAQALTSGNLTRDVATNVSLYSFGPIKTATALGGGATLVADPELRERMEAIANRWPRQSTPSYFARVIKMSLLKLLSQPQILGAFVWLLECFGQDADAWVGHSARGFSDARLFASLRQRPCSALQHLLARRLLHMNKSRIAARTARGTELANNLPDPLFVAGCDNPSHTYWVCPVVCDDPIRVVRKLRAAGYDASQHSGLAVVENDGPQHWFRRIVFVPRGGEMKRLMAVSYKL